MVFHAATKPFVFQKEPWGRGEKIEARNQIQARALRKKKGPQERAFPPPPSLKIKIFFSFEHRKRRKKIAR